MSKDASASCVKTSKDASISCTITCRLERNLMNQKNEKELSIEEVFEKLDTTVSKLESRDISLEDSFRLYAEGMEMLRYCSEKIDTVEKKMLLMSENGEFHEF